MKLFNRLAAFVLTKKIFSAASAGLTVTATTSLKGLELEFSGYNDKIHLLIDMVTKDLKNIADDIDESVFEVQRAEMKKNYANQLLSTSNLRIDFSTKILSNNYFTDLEYYEIIDTISLDDVQRFAFKFFEEFKMHVLVQGNITRSQACQIVENLEENLGGDPLHGVNFEHFFITLIQIFIKLLRNMNFNHVVINCLLVQAHSGWVR